MKSIINFLLTAAMCSLLLTATVAGQATGPLRVLSSNPRYFTDGSGKAIYLTGSHNWNSLQDSGAVYPPPAFDYTAYLNFLQARNHNFIRMWAREQPRWAPWTLGEDFVEPMPFARPGPGTALDGKPKFNLEQFNQEYFDRLRSRVIAAGERGIYVSIMLFDGWGIDKMSPVGLPGNPWPSHPFNAANNVNGINGDPGGNNEGEEVHQLLVPEVTNYQKAYVRKVIDTVNDLDNVLYEISNESRAYSTDWQYEMIKFIKLYEAGKSKQHPVGMTFQYWNGDNSTLLNSPADWISPANREGADYKGEPPAATGAKVIISDTDHLWGEGGNREWVWKSFLRGLNTIFMDGGITTFPATSDWRDSARNAMGHTRSYANKMNLAGMTPQGDLSSTGYCLANAGVEYLVYQPGFGGFTVRLGAGNYSLEWFNPSTGAASTGGSVSGGATSTFEPPFIGDAVLYLRAAGGSNSPPTASLTTPSNGVSLPAPATVLLAANASDADGSVTRVEFYEGATLLGADTNGSDGWSLTSTFGNAGSYILTAKATDNQGATTVSSPVSITVTPIPSPTPAPAPNPGGSLSDDFNDNQIDTSKWNLGSLNGIPPADYTLISVVEQNQRLEIQPAANIADNQYNGYISAATWNFTNRWSSVEMISAPKRGTETIFGIGIDSNNYYRFVVRGSLLYFQEKFNGVLTQTSIAFDADHHRFLRFRHDPVTDHISFETSPDGLKWNDRWAVTRDLSLTSVRIELAGGTSPGVVASEPMIFDNFVLSSP